MTAHLDICDPFACQEPYLGEVMSLPRDCGAESRSLGLLHIVCSWRLGSWWRCTLHICSCSALITRVSRPRVAVLMSLFVQPNCMRWSIIKCRRSSGAFFLACIIVYHSVLLTLRSFVLFEDVSIRPDASIPETSVILLVGQPIVLFVFLLFLHEKLC